MERCYPVVSVDPNLNGIGRQVQVPFRAYTLFDIALAEVSDGSPADVEPMFDWVLLEDGGLFLPYEFNRYRAGAPGTGEHGTSSYSLLGQKLYQFPTSIYEKAVEFAQVYKGKPRKTNGYQECLTELIHYVLLEEVKEVTLNEYMNSFLSFK